MRANAHPTAAVRFRLPVARMIEDASAATTVAPSRLHKYCSIKLPAQKMAGRYSCRTSDSEEGRALWAQQCGAERGIGHKGTDLRSATSCASVFLSRPVTVRWRPEEASFAAGEHSQRHRLVSSASLYLQGAPTPLDLA